MDGTGEQIEYPADGLAFYYYCQSTVETPGSQKKHLPPTVENYRTQFYETYRKEAKDYDEEFIKKYDQDLDTTLIFVCYAYCSGTCVFNRFHRLVCSLL